jgi:hypothetical protein
MFLGRHPVMAVVKRFAMRDRRNVSWWHFGVIGGLALSLATGYKFLQAIPRLWNGIIPWTELLAIAGLAFLIGSICGCVVWFLRKLSSRFGLTGDAVIGAVTVNVYFPLLAAFVDRELLRLWMVKESVLTMFGVATVLGAGAGLLFGMDQRRRWRNEA